MQAYAGSAHSGEACTIGSPIPSRRGLTRPPGQITKKSLWLSFRFFCRAAIWIAAAWPVPSES